MKEIQDLKGRILELMIKMRIRAKDDKELDEVKVWTNQVESDLERYYQI